MVPIPSAFVPYYARFVGKRPLCILLLASCAAACGGSRAEERPDEHARRDGNGPSRHDEGDDEPEGLDAFSRALARDATWRDLVALARRLDDRRADSSETGCLLSGDATRGFRLAGNLAVTVRPLSAPEPRTVGDLTLSLAVVSRWGSHFGTPAASVPRIVADFTLTRPPSASAAHAVLGVSRESLTLVVLGTTSEQVTLAELPERLRAAARTHVHVIADPDVPLARIATVLDALDATGTEIALAVLLPDGARAPDPERAGGEGPALCADGLPEPAGDATPPDTRELMAIRSSLAPLRQAAEHCQSEAMATGIGTVELLLAFRVEPDGSVPEACVVEESRPAGALRRCLVAAARGIAFPPSTSRGPLVLELPFSLRPSETTAQRARCR